MDKKSTIVAGMFFAAIAIFVAVFLSLPKKTAVVPPALTSTPAEEEKEEGLGAQLFAEARNPLNQVSIAANPFSPQTNAFAAETNPFAVETNPLKSFYQNPFQ